MPTPRSLLKVAQQLSDAIILADPLGRVTWINPACTRLCGYTLDEMKGRKPGELLRGPDTDPAASRRLGEAIRLGRDATVELVNYHKSGEPYTVSISLSPLRDRAGRVTGFIAVERETSPVQRQFRQLESQVTQLYDILCHVSAPERAA